MSSRSDPPVVVVAASVEGLDALVRLLHQLPTRLPALLVGTVHGIDDEQLRVLVRGRLRAVQVLRIAAVATHVLLIPGRVHLAPASSRLGFTAGSVLGAIPDAGPDDRDTGANRLFESAARVHGKSVIGVILSGRGHDGTRGMLAITAAGGTRVVQSPCEATHPAMPSHALMNDHVNYSVMLDDMGRLLCELIRRTVR